MQEIAKNRNGKCLSKRYVNSGNKLNWQCAEKHVWEATPEKIKRGTWCPKCSMSRTKPTSMQEIPKCNHYEDAGSSF